MPTRVEAGYELQLETKPGKTGNSKLKKYQPWAEEAISERPATYVEGSAEVLRSSFRKPSQ
jgi:hypothetical protein